METDKHGRGLEAYPASTDDGRLLGFNVFGNAAYATDAVVSLAILDEAGDLEVPPRDRWLGHEFPLDEVGLTPGEYVLYVADDRGPWRALTSWARDGVEAADVDPDRIVGEIPKQRDAASLVSELRAASDWGERAELAGELRQVALDRPGSVVPVVTDVVELLDDRANERAGPPDADGAPTGESDRDQHRTSARRDLGFVVDRAAREDWSGVESTFRRLVLIAGDRELSDPETAYKRHLLDVLDRRGRVDTPATVDRIERWLGDDDPTVRRRTLNALYHLEYRYASDSHPLLEDPGFRDAVADRTDDADAGVRDRAESVETLHGFHP